MTREAEPLRTVLGRVGLRLGVAAALQSLARAMVVVSLGLLVWALATLVAPLPFPVRDVALAAAGGLLLSFPVLAWRLRPSRLMAARQTDRRLGLADRLSTAMESLATSGAQTGLVRLQIADAMEYARGIAPRQAAPIVFPRELWIALAAAGALILWAHFLQGWSIPGLPSGRLVQVIRNEGRQLTTIGRQLEAVSRARGLPETRRAAPQLQDLGRRLQGSRVSRHEALGLLREVGRELDAAQTRVARRLGGAGLRGTPRPQDARVSPTAPADPSRLTPAIRELESLAGRLLNERTPGTRDDLAQRLRTLGESLDQMNAPASSRRDVETARRELERGRLSAASSALSDALQDLQGFERMLGDEQALGEARRQVQKSAERIVQGPLAGGAQMTGQAPPEPGPPPSGPGSNPVTLGQEEGVPPPPGPNQGSLPGQGRGPKLGAPTLRLGGSRVEEHLTGRQGEGGAITRDLLAPGREGTPHLPTAPVPADVAHENDRALARDPLPPVYRTVIRRYFEALADSR